jgi:hypothetical protein
MPIPNSLVLKLLPADLTDPGSGPTDTRFEIDLVPDQMNYRVVMIESVIDYFPSWQTSLHAYDFHTVKQAWKGFRLIMLQSA